MEKIIEKDYHFEIDKKLSDIEDGVWTRIRHIPENPSGSPLVEASFVSPGLRLKTETYDLYPGICLSYHLYQGDRFQICHTHSASVLSIDHCRYGRIGWEMRDGLSLYFGSGDLAFHITDKCADSLITLPLGYYEGLSVSIDLDIVKEQQPELVRETDMDICMLCRRFCMGREAAALPSGSRIAPLFSEVYDLPEPMKLPYLKLKCQELLFSLYMTDLSEARTLDVHYSGQVEIIRQIHQVMTAHPERRYTIEELSRQYLVNTASLKKVFKAVYGMPVASYMKQYRIELAARLLRESDESIAGIARAAGYESQSKFSAAFKNAMKILPTEYRRQYRSSL